MTFLDAANSILDDPEWGMRVRSLNVFLAAVSTSVMIATLIRRWDDLTHRVRRIGIGMALVLAAGCYGSASAISMRAPAGIGVYFVAFALSSLILLTLYKFTDDS